MTPAPVRLLEVPYDSGRREVRMGRGPEALRGPVADALRARGHAVETERVESGAPFQAEVATTFELARVLAGRVREARREGSFPLVLAGNCSASLGVLGGISGGPVGVVWMDAHGDLNTPETTRSGFLDGMALSVALGRCWREMAGGVAGFRAVPEEHVLHVGGRDLDPAEEETLSGSGILRVRPGESVKAALETVAARVQRVYLHLDLDVLDPSEGRANGYAAPGGLSLREVLDVILEVSGRFDVCAATLSAYDPEHDPEGRVPAAAARLGVAALDAGG